MNYVHCFFFVNKTIENLQSSNGVKRKKYIKKCIAAIKCNLARCNQMDVCYSLHVNCSCVY